VPYINHVAIPVDDVDQASAFYEDWFGARVVPSPRFSVPVAWVLLGKVQVHLVQHPGRPSTAYHFAVAVEERARFEALYWRAEREDAFDRVTFHHHIYEMPSGGVQMWIRDVSSNIVEINYQDIDDLDPRIVAARKRWADYHEQSEWNTSSSLFMPEQAGLALEVR